MRFDAALERCLVVHATHDGHPLPAVVTSSAPVTAAVIKERLYSVSRSMELLRSASRASPVADSSTTAAPIARRSFKTAGADTGRLRAASMVSLGCAEPV